MTSPRSWWRPAPPTGIETALTLAALVLLLRPMGPWYVQAPLLCVGALSIVQPPLARVPALWLAAAAAIGLRLVIDWPLPDNHIYLLAYWCLAAALALQGPSPDAHLARASRLLLAAAMTLAVLWKGLLSPDYIDGRFFRVTLLDDPRFEAVTMLVGGLDEAALDENRAVLSPLPDGAELLDPPELREPAALRAFATALTWGGLGLEALLAAALWMPSRRARAVQHGLLLAFCLITYAFAPVAGFGWLLLIMGLCLCRPDQRVLRGAYVATFFVVLLVTEVPWASLLLQGWRAFGV
jgi:hypothetical protein